MNSFFSSTLYCCAAAIQSSLNFIPFSTTSFL
nr:MAG TPA: hypothetical protein [Caudoviricetes sp.]